MATDRDLTEMTDEISTLLKERLGIRRGDTLAQKLIFARTLLPRPIHKSARQVADAAKLGAHPKLLKQIDWTATRAAHVRVTKHLKTVDPKERRKGIILGAVTGLLMNLLILVLGILGVFWLMPL